MEKSNHSALYTIHRGAVSDKIICQCPHCYAETVPFWNDIDDLDDDPFYFEACDSCGGRYSFMAYKKCDETYETKSFPLFEYRFIFGILNQYQDSGEYYGHIIGTSHGMNFAGVTKERAEEDFRDVVDLYIDEIITGQIK